MWSKAKDKFCEQMLVKMTVLIMRSSFFFFFKQKTAYEIGL